MAGLDDLTRLVPPPAGTSPTDWRVVENTLGMPLPDDYKRLADTYGPGTFCGFIHLCHPRGATEWVDLTGPMPARLQQQLLEDRDSCRYPAPHNPEDLFAVGVTDNGNHLFWITSPSTEPDAWRLTVNEADGQDWYTHDGSLTDFLVSVLSCRVHVPAFPRRLLDDGVSFSPSQAAQQNHRPGPHPASASISSRAVRECARTHGYDVPDRGRIPADVIDAWRQSQ